MRLPTFETSSPITTHPEFSAYMEHYFGYPMEALLAPIGETQVGESVRHNGVYFQIKEARREDDSSLPQGVWTHELKTADWEQVESTAIEALCHKSKDLQLGVWLMESKINRHGFAGIAPAAVLLRILCESFWDNMHPKMLDGDIEFRTNPINWINEKLSLKLRLIPITNTPLDGREFTWDDWDNAQRYEQLKLQHQGQIQWEGVTTDSFKQRLSATSKESLLALCGQLDDAIIAIDALILWLDQLCGNNSPSLSEITSLCNNISTMLVTELKRRGIDPSAENHTILFAGEDQQNHGEDGANSNGGEGGNGGGGDNGDDIPLTANTNGVIRNRADAFAHLLEAAEFLMRDDPHSPVPYMVYTACEWGEKTAPDLYHELFLQKGGQLNIFEVMGLALADDKNQ